MFSMFNFRIDVHRYEIPIILFKFALNVESILGNHLK